MPNTEFNRFGVLQVTYQRMRTYRVFCCCHELNKHNWYPPLICIMEISDNLLILCWVTYTHWIMWNVVIFFQFICSNFQCRKEDGVQGSNFMYIKKIKKINGFESLRRVDIVYMFCTAFSSSLVSYIITFVLKAPAFLPLSLQRFIACCSYSVNCLSSCSTPSSSSGVSTGESSASTEPSSRSGGMSGAVPQICITPDESEVRGRALSRLNGSMLDLQNMDGADDLSPGDPEDKWVRRSLVELFTVAVSYVFVNRIVKWMKRSVVDDSPKTPYWLVTDLWTCRYSCYP